MIQVKSSETDTTKLQELILFIAEKSEFDPAFEALKLNKLLYLSDFLHFLNHGSAITGQTYQRLEMGPAPTTIRHVLDAMQIDGTLAIARRTHFGCSVLRPVSLRPADITGFSGTEIAVADYVLEQCRRIDINQMSDLSRHLLGWQSVALNETIPYGLALVDHRELTQNERAWALDTTDMEFLKTA